ncbi:unnamed protein product (mitochondrion) [Plasmodiophora brassicae]|uniref:Uncharacterized protein n=1 Tax=Plasmodiophora brassicae TaxID=37360 RepID=A0A3P3YGA1_PLABS|nr:unnamed protein product [Plasmodiophora brassicae]
MSSIRLSTRHYQGQTLDGTNSALLFFQWLTWRGSDVGIFVEAYVECIRRRPELIYAVAGAANGTGARAAHDPLQRRASPPTDDEDDETTEWRVAAGARR